MEVFYGAGIKIYFALYDPIPHSEWLKQPSSYRKNKIQGARENSSP